MTNEHRPDLTTEQVFCIRQVAERRRQEFDGTFNLETIERYIQNSQELLHSQGTFTVCPGPHRAPRPRPATRACTTRSRRTRSNRRAVLVRPQCRSIPDRRRLPSPPRRRSRRRVLRRDRPRSRDQRRRSCRHARGRRQHLRRVSQRWTDEIARAADVIVSMGCGDACPIYPGRRYEDRDVPDPSGQPIGVAREIRDDIRIRVEALIAALELDRPSAGLVR